MKKKTILKYGLIIGLNHGYYEECDKNIDINIEKTSLCRAIEKGNIEIVNLLLIIMLM